MDVNDAAARMAGSSRVRALAALVIFVLVPCAYAADDIVVIGDAGSQIQQRFVSGFKQYMATKRPEQSVIFRDVASVGAEAAPRQPLLYVTIGAVAANRAEQHGLRPVINAIVTDAEMPANAGDATRTVLSVEQPVERTLRLVSTALPAVKTITVIVGPNSAHLAPAFMAACQSQQRVCDIIRVDDASRIDGAVQQAAREDRVLVVTPDSAIINSVTAQPLILGAYLRGVALVGFSQAFVKAGALMALYSSPSQLGEDAADVAVNAMAHRPIVLPPGREPARYSVSVNYQVARALAIDLPEEQQLVEAVRAGETKR